MANEWKIEQKKAQKRKQFYIKLGLFVVVILMIIAFGFYGKYNDGKPSQLFKSHLNKVGTTEEFEFSITGNKGWHYIGIAVNDPIYFHFDGNYTVEYHKDGKFLKKEIFNQENLKKYYKEHMFSGGATYWAQMPLGKVYEDGKYKVKVTVHEIEKPLKGYKKEVYFYVDRPYFRMEKYYTQEELDKSSAEYERSQLIKNLIDVNETNPNIMSLRKALEQNSFEKVKQIIEADNNITVNTDMVFKRRPLFYAAFNNNEKLAQYLIDEGADIHYKDELGENALSYAIENNATKTAKLLIESGIDVNEVVFVHNYLHTYITITKTSCISPLQYTAGNAFYEMTELLLRNKITDNAIQWETCNNQGKNNEEIYKFLFYEGRTSIKDKERNKILKLFKKYNYTLTKPKPTNQIGY